jgi:membrane protease YdiL (CAAX protease family)
MARLSIGEAALEGVRLIGRQPLAILVWSLAFFLFGVLPASAVAWAMAGGRALSMIDSGSLLADYLPWAVLPVSAVLYAAIYRAVMRPHEAGYTFLRLGGEEARQFLLLMIRILLVVVLAIAGLFFAAFFWGVGRAMPPAIGWLLQLAGLLLAFGLGVFVWLRLSMAAPMSFAEGRFRLFESWRFTKGRIGALFGLMLAVVVMTVLAEILAVVALFGLVEVAAGMLRWRGEQAAAAFTHPIAPGAIPYLMGLGLAYSLVCVSVQAIAVAPWARAYQTLAGTAATAATKAPQPPRQAAAFPGLPASARLGPAWTAPLVLILAMAAAMGLLTVGLVLSLGLARLGGGRITTASMQGWLPDLILSVTFDLLTVALLVAWGRRVERRPLASLGFGGGFRLGDIAWFLGGAFWAFALALGLGLAAQAIAAAVVDPGGAASALTLPPEALAQAPLVLLVIVLLAFSEEVMFRGWLLSAVAPRTGMPAAIAISSLLFAAFHVLPWELADPARLVSFLSYTAIGAGFAVVAVGRGQIWSSTALHAGYNSFLAFATMATQHATPRKLWGAVSEQQRGSATADQAFMTLGLNIAITALLIGLLLYARRRWNSRAAPAAAVAG